MALSFTFQLTPSQTELLLRIAFGYYKPIGNPNGIGTPQSLLPDWESPHFVSVVQKLIYKGLVTHDNSRNPSFMPTDKGVVIAEQIADDAVKIVKLRAKRRPLPEIESVK